VAHGGIGRYRLLAACDNTALGTVRAIRPICSPAIWPTAPPDRSWWDGGRALLRRWWNVHPTFSQKNRRLIENVSPRRVLPAFGDARFYTIWRACLAPREVITIEVTELERVVAPKVNARSARFYLEPKRLGARD